MYKSKRKSLEDIWKLDEYKELYGPAIMKSNERFFGSTREKEWTNSVNQIKNFFKNREKIYNNQLNTLEVKN